MTWQKMIDIGLRRSASSVNSLEEGRVVGLLVDVHVAILVNDVLDLMIVNVVRLAVMLNVMIIIVCVAMERLMVILLIHGLLNNEVHLGQDGPIDMS